MTEWTDAKLRGIASDYFPESKDWPAAMNCLRHLLMEQAAKKRPIWSGESYMVPGAADESMQKAMQRAVMLRKSMNEVWMAALSEAPEPLPHGVVRQLTDAELTAEWDSCCAIEYPFDTAGLMFAESVMRACAEAWGLTLADAPGNKIDAARTA